ncbi:MFS transporter [Sporosarcina obsidiansis]|uniref:MFS transporter n=1 Tax=Sporosarcina obsidiansis TaxID=2660748 RepID=UPI00129B9F09|nr:MFS transporter [Sporosarcina obsidiansis]
MEVSTQLSQNQRSKLMLILTLVLVISAMNTTMFNVALPTIGEQFSLLPSQTGWIVTSYLIIFAVGVTIYGKLADQYKLKNLITIGIILMALGSLIGLFALNYPSLVIARVIQAAGAAVLPALAMIIPTRYFTPETRGRAIGMTSAGLTFGIAIGPIIAGLILTSFSWDYLFIIPLLMVLSIPAFRKYLGDEKGVQSKIDFMGAFLLVATIVSFMLVVSQSSLILLIAFVIFLILFIWRIKTAANPFIHPDLFKNKAYTLTLLTFALGAGVAFSMPYLSPLMFVNINHLSPFASGLFMFPGALIAALLAKTGGKIADTKGNSTLAYITIVLFFICFALLSFLAGTSAYLVMVILVLGYVAQSQWQVAMANTLSNTLSKEQTGIGMGLFMLVNFVASSISGTFIGKALSTSSSVSLNPLHIPADGTEYSNIYVVLTIIVVIIAILYTVVLKSTDNKKSL